MVRGEATTDIARPVDTVFDFVVADFFRNYPRWSPEVTELEPLDGSAGGHGTGRPPVALGTRARQVRVDHGRRSDTVVGVVALEPNRRVAFASEGNPSFTSAFEFAAHGDATTLRFHFELTELKFYMRPFESLIRRAIQEGAERTVVNIRDLVEAER